jgi:hypothetical protein
MTTLTVLVSASCPACGRALALAEHFATERPDVAVDVVDVDDPGWSPFPDFAGTPMYYNGDTVVFYGNPTPEQLHRAFPMEAT